MYVPFKINLNFVKMKKTLLILSLFLCFVGKATNIVISSNTTMMADVTTPCTLTINVGKTLTTNGFKYTNVDTLIINGTLAISNNSLFGDFCSVTTIVNCNPQSTVNYCKTGNQSVSGGNVNNLLFGYYNLTLSGSGTKTISSGVNIINSLNLGSGITFDTQNILTLKSTSAQTAYISAIPSSSSIIGKVFCERFIPSVGRRWRFLSSPISNTTIEDWRGEVYITGTGQGTNIGNLNSNGFDATPSNASSLYTYDETVSGGLNNGWIVATNTSNALSIGKGYRILIRGDRSSYNRLNGIDNTQNAVTLSLFGNINSGSISMPVTYTSSGGNSNDGWNLLGNPYPSSYNWNQFWGNANSSCIQHISSVIYVWNPNCNCYNSFNASSNSGTLSGGVIPQGVGFFVHATSSNPTLILSENFKTSNSGGSYLKTNDKDEFTVHLSKIGDSITYDDLIIKYNADASVTADDYDIVKMNGDINISAYDYTDNTQLALTCRPIVDNDIIPIKLTAALGNYSISLSDINTTKLYVYLKDKYTNMSIDLTVNPIYNFTVDSDNVLITERFEIIVFDKTTTGLNILENNKYPMHPNPAKYYVQFNKGEDIEYIDVRNTMGTTLCRKYIYDTKMDVSDLPIGVYFLSIKDGSGKTVKKIVVN